MVGNVMDVPLTGIKQMACFRERKPRVRVAERRRVYVRFTRSAMSTACTGVVIE